MTSLTFLGSAGAVIGSKYLLESEGRRILIDCGLCQGFKQLRERNWAPMPIDPKSIDAVLLTHAHRHSLKERLGWEARVPEHRERVEL